MAEKTEQKSDRKSVNLASLLADSNHPLYLHPSDAQATTLVSHGLTGSENYATWSRSIRIALTARNKIWVIDGTCKRQDMDPGLYDQWDRCNATVLSWLLNSVHKEIGTGIAFATSAHGVWEDLRERYGKTDGAKILNLHREMNSLVQGTMSVSAYYSKLKVLWDEYEALVPPPNCECKASREFIKTSQRQKLLQFLTGLSDNYTMQDHRL